jgi:peptidyl-prolyl cis-trans isomerase C
MKYPHYLALIASLAVVTGCDQLPTPAGTDNSSTAAIAGTPVVEGVVVATVNGQPITQAELQVYTGQRKAPPSSSPDANNSEAILNELITLELMRQESISKGLDKKAVVIATLNQQQRTALAGAAIQDFMISNPVTDEDAKIIYDEKLGKAGTEYNARHILVKEQEEAEAIIKLLDSGSDFSELAKQKSTGPSGASGGKLGWFNENQMVKPFSEATGKLEKGKYTTIPVQTQFGWHVIILDDSRESAPPPFDDVKDRLKMTLTNQQLQQHVEAARSTASIDIK